LNWVGFTKILTTTISLACFAFSTSDRCPWCKAPIVGTKPMVLPVSLSPERNCCVAAMVLSIIKMLMLYVTRAKPGMMLLNINNLGKIPYLCTSNLGILPEIYFVSLTF